MSGNGLCPPPIDAPRRLHRSPRHSLAASFSELREERSHPSEADRAVIAGHGLFQAAAAGDEATVKRLLDGEMDANSVNLVDISGKTSLQAAAECGHDIVVKMLLDAGANVNAVPQTSAGRPALQAASGNGHIGVVRILISAGADVNILPPGGAGRTALQAAAEYGHEEVVRILLSAGADTEAPASALWGRTALQAAAGAGKEKVVEILLSAGANINAPPSELYGRTALQAAAEDGREAVVSMLLKCQPDVDALPASSYGRTALQAASENGHENVVRMLLAANASTNAPASEISGGKTALQAAAGNGHEKIVQLLLDVENKLDIIPSDYDSAEALEAAVAAGHLGVVKILLNNGISINTKNSLGRTCLFSPLLSAEMLKELLDLGAYLNVQDFDGLTPLHCAAKSGDTVLFIALLEAGADMEIQDNRTRRPLHIALERRYEDIVKMLLESGDNIRNSTAWGWRETLKAQDGDIVMISENSSRVTDLALVNINAVEIGVESEESLQVKQFYSSCGLDSGDLNVLKLLDPSLYMSKYLVIQPSRPSPDSEKAEIKWMWALVNPKKDHLHQGRNYGPGIPNIGRVITTAQAKALLICHASFDFYVHIPPDGTDPALGGVSFMAEVKKSQISWIMRKSESSERDRGSNPIFRSMNYRSSLECGWIPNHGVDFFSIFVEDLANKWMGIFDRAEAHLNDTRRKILLKAGKGTSLIETLLKDAQQWADFRELLRLHVQKAKGLVREFQEKRLLHEEVDEYELMLESDCGETATLIERLEDEESADSDLERRKKKKEKKNKKRNKKKRQDVVDEDEDDKGSRHSKKKKKHEDESQIQKLSRKIKKMNDECKHKISKLERRTKEMIELEFNLVSIFEARISTSTAVSMKRLTWITFIFLPLLFVASLFGMNIDLLGNNQVPWWYYAIMSGAIFVMVLAGWACFKHFAQVEGWCKNRLPPMAFMRRRKKRVVDDEENANAWPNMENYKFS